MLSSKHLWKLEFNGYLIVYFFVEQGHGEQMLRMQITSRGLYTGENFKQIIRKKRMKIWNLINNNDLINQRVDVNFFFVKKYFAITACTTYTFTFEKGLLIKKW